METLSILKASSNDLLCNISNMSMSVRLGFPDTEKQMKAQGRRPSAFIVLRCLETPVKCDTRVFDMAYKTIPLV